MDNAPATPSANPGRYIRAALVIFPVGTIILGVGSFGIWWYQRTRVEERIYRHATALRREMSLVEVERHTGVLGEVRAMPGWQSLAGVGSYMESSMSAENMGYNPRRDFFRLQGGGEASNVDAELTGKKRPREVVLVLAPYGSATPGQAEAERRALAGLLSLAHSLAGEQGPRTLRFAAVPLGVKDEQGRDALTRLLAGVREREERLMFVHVLGGVEAPVLEQIRTALRPEATGTVVEALPAAPDAATTLQAMQTLRPVLLREVQP